MNTEKVAQAVKDYLITLAIADKLPLDMTLLDLDSLEEVIKSTEEDNEIAYEKAGSYLSDGEISLEEMVEAIAKHSDQNDLIDNVEGVVVWFKVENRFTCDEFLNLIEYTV